MQLLQRQQQALAAAGPKAAAPGSCRPSVPLLPAGTSRGALHTPRRTAARRTQAAAQAPEKQAFGVFKLAYDVSAVGTESHEMIFTAVWCAWMHGPP